MSAPQEVGTLPARRLTKEQAADLPHEHGTAWDEETQRFIPRGDVFALARQGKEADPAFQLAAYDQRREALLRFVSGKLKEAEYNDRKYPLPGLMHDYYILPGFDKKTATKGCASKIADLLRLRVAKKRVTAAVFTADHGSARVCVELVDANGQPAGAHEAACSTAEKGFQSAAVRCKYGAVWERSKGEFVKELEPPDYRAAENDVVSRAGKRAFVGAVIVAASLEEVFDLETSTDAAGEENGDQEQGTTPTAKAAPAKPRAPAARPAPKSSAKAAVWPFGDKKGTALTEFSSDELTRMQAWCDSHHKEQVGQDVAAELVRRAAASRQQAATEDALDDEDFD